ncbi:MAG: hypothetical protein CMN77_06595 [Spirochaetaceae bacterium]|nr:hypothetical protein [Spirochaetaceae bacterium]
MVDSSFISSREECNLDSSRGTESQPPRSIVSVRPIRMYHFFFIGRGAIRRKGPPVQRVKDFVALLILSLVFCPLALQAQQKIPLNPPNWRILETDRFEIHYQKGSYLLALEAGRIAESEANRIQKVLRHSIGHKIKIFLYPSDQDFQATSILPVIPSESTGGFTDFARHRVVLPFTGDYQKLRHVLVHEIIHAYQFDIAEESPGRFPLWLMEGMCEYLSIGWDADADARIRDLMIHQRMPGLVELHSGNVNPYMYYKGGQSIMHFIAEEFGEERIGVFYKELVTLEDFDAAFKAAFGVSPAAFDLMYRDFLADRYGEAMASSERDERLSRLTFRYLDGIGLQLRPVFSPDGKYFAYLSYDGIFPALMIQRVGAPYMDPGKRKERMVILRQLRSRDFEQWYPLTNRLSFGPSGTMFLVTRKEGRPGIAQISVKDGELLRFQSLPFDMVQFPKYDPESESILFTGVAGATADLYRLGWKDGSLQRISQNPFYESDAMQKGGCIYYVADRGDPGLPSSAGYRTLFRKCNITEHGTTADRNSGPGDAILNLKGDVSHPVPGPECSVYFLSNHEGVRNIYRLKDACERKTEAGPERIDRITASDTEILHLDSYSGSHEPSDASGDSPTQYSNRNQKPGPDDPNREFSLLFSRLEEGALEVRMLTPESGNETVAEPSLATFLPRNYELSALDPGGPELKSLEASYDPALTLARPPILFITGGSDANGNSSLAGAAYFALADDSGFHDLEGLITYQDNPVNTNVDIRYGYSRWRTKFYAGLYSSRGTFAIFSFLDFSLNQLLYNPYFRLIDQRSTGGYAAVSYPLHSFGALSATYEVAREEKVFTQAQPEQRDREDIFQNRQSFTFQYTFDNTVNSLYGPLDGQALRLSYSVPFRPGGNQRHVYVAGAEYRFYHLFDDFSLFAFRALAARVSGPDAELYPLSVGGYYTIRGYPFLEFEGRNAFVINLEYRFTFIHQLLFGAPFRWSPGLIRGAIFFDAGAAFDDHRRFQAFDGDVGVTRDLNASFGVGVHWSNFLWFIFPGALMKIEWATPYDGKRSLPLSQWEGRFSVGFSF